MLQSVSSVWSEPGVLKEKRVEEKDEGTWWKAFLSLGQLAGGVILGVALWLRHDSQTSSLLILQFEGHQAPGTFYISEYTDPQSRHTKQEAFQWRRSSTFQKADVWMSNAATV